MRKQYVKLSFKKKNKNFLQKKKIIKYKKYLSLKEIYKNYKFNWKQLNNIIKKSNLLYKYINIFITNYNFCNIKLIWFKKKINFSIIRSLIWINFKTNVQKKINPYSTWILKKKIKKFCLSFFLNDQLQKILYYKKIFIKFLNFNLINIQKKYFWSLFQKQYRDFFLYKTGKFITIIKYSKFLSNQISFLYKLQMPLKQLFLSFPFVFKHLLMTSFIYNPKKIYIINSLNLFQKKKKSYHIFYKKTKLNCFLTLTNNKGNVLFSLSYGKLNFKHKRQKKDRDTYYFLCVKFSELCKKLKIKTIKSIHLQKNKSFDLKMPKKSALKLLIIQLKKKNISIKGINCIFFKPHGQIVRKKKLRRL